MVLAGDYNVVPTDRDIYAVRSYADDALLQPAPRAQFQKLLRQGWRDGVRALHPDAALYTYWSYLRNRWLRDAGLRIDHLLLSAVAAKRLAANIAKLPERGVVTKRKPQAQRRLGLLSCCLNLRFWLAAGRLGGWGAAQLNPPP